MECASHRERSSSNADVNPAADGFELPADFQMPTAEEIEHDLALGEPGWISLPNTSAEESTQTVSWLRGVYAGSWRAFVFVAAVAAITAVGAGTATANAFPHRGVGTYMQQGSSRVHARAPRFIWTARGPRPVDKLINSAGMTS